MSKIISKRFNNESFYKGKFNSISPTKSLSQSIGSKTAWASNTAATATATTASSTSLKAIIITVATVVGVLAATGIGFGTFYALKKSSQNYGEFCLSDDMCTPSANLFCINQACGCKTGYMLVNQVCIDYKSTLYKFLSVEKSKRLISDCNGQPFDIPISLTKSNVQGKDFYYLSATDNIFRFTADGTCDLNVPFQDANYLVATPNGIYITLKNNGVIVIFDFDLNGIKKVGNCDISNNPCFGSNLQGMYYDEKNDRLYVYEADTGIYTFDSGLTFYDFFQIPLPYGSSLTLYNGRLFLGELNKVHEIQNNIKVATYEFLCDPSDSVKNIISNLVITSPDFFFIYPCWSKETLEMMTPTMNYSIKTNKLPTTIFIDDIYFIYAEYNAVYIYP